MANEVEESKSESGDVAFITIDGMRIWKESLEIVTGIGGVHLVKGFAAGEQKYVVAYYRRREDALQLIQDIRAAVHPRLRIDGDGILRIVEPKHRKAAKGGAA